MTWNENIKKGLTLPWNAYDTNFFFWRKYLAYRMYKPIPWQEELQKT